MYNPANMDEETMLLIQSALLALEDDSEGRSILEDASTDGMVASTGEEHLGTYGDAVSTPQVFRLILKVSELNEESRVCINNNNSSSLGLTGCIEEKNDYWPDPESWVAKLILNLI